MTVFIDDPADREITQQMCEIRGWCRVPPFGSGRVRFQIGGNPVVFTSMRRPDVEAAYPQEKTFGFVIHLDLSCYMLAIRDSALDIEVLGGDTDRTTVRFRVSTSALRKCMAAASGA